MKLREALDKLNRVKGLTHAEQGECGSAEKEWKKYEFQYTVHSTFVAHLPLSLYADPEEFLNLLFKHVLSLKDPFIKLQ